MQFPMGWRPWVSNCHNAVRYGVAEHWSNNNLKHLVSNWDIAALGEELLKWFTRVFADLIISRLFSVVMKLWQDSVVHPVNTLHFSHMVMELPEEWITLSWIMLSCLSWSWSHLSKVDSAFTILTCAFQVVEMLWHCRRFMYWNIGGNLQWWAWVKEQISLLLNNVTYLNILIIASSLQFILEERIFMIFSDSYQSCIYDA